MQRTLPVISILLIFTVFSLGGFLFFISKKTTRRIDTTITTPVLEKQMEEIPALANDFQQNQMESVDKSGAISKTPPAKPDIKPTRPLKNLEVAINDCRKSQDSASCLDEYFREYLKISETKKILTELDKLQIKDANIRLFCHEIMHSIGRETLRKTGTVSASFNACDQTCHSGCYHGAMERFLRGEEGAKFGTSDRLHVNEEEFKQKAVTACNDNDPVNFKFQCLHGLGHAIVFTLGYNLFKSLAWCDNLNGSWDQSSCWGGAFMENITALDKSKRFLSKTDYHFPCSVVEEKYKNECYVMQTSRMLEMGLSVNQVAEECKKAGIYRNRCFVSLGRDKSNDARTGPPGEISKICASLETEIDKTSCTAGVSYALSDNTWDGRYVFPFCESFEKEDDIRYCYNVTVNYLKTSLVVGKNKVLESCKAFVPASTICIEEAEKLPF